LRKTSKILFNDKTDNGFYATMPAFVFMIPVIAFFGTGKVAAVIITMIFGGLQLSD